MLIPVHKASALLSLIAGAFLAGGAAGQAADNTRYISIAGDNANPCTLVRPCRTLQFGIGQTPAGGELRILESGFYGNNATINKSLTIAGNGHTVYLGSPLTVDKAGAVVALRGLTLNGQGTIPRGINIIAAATVHIERCVIHRFADDGIHATASGVEVTVLESISRDNGGRGFHFSAGAASRLTVDNSQFDNNGDSGIVILSGKAAVYRSSLSGNGNNGFTISNASVTAMWTVVAQGPFAGFAAGSGSTMTLEFSLAHGNAGYGLQISSGGTVRMSNSTIIAVGGFAINNNGTLQSRGNNNVIGAVIGNAKVPIAGF